MPDKIEILSYPGPDRSITPEILKSYRVISRRYRNRRIGEFLKELHLTEGRNTGFRKIINALEHNGSPQPLFETDDDRTFFATTLYIHPDFIGVGKNDTINSNDEAILAFMREDPKITRKQLCEELGVSDSTISRSIDKLRRLKYITRVGSNKSGYWKILSKNNSNH